MTMTVKELIATLEEYDEDLPVHFAYNYGDYWKTTVAPNVREVALLSVEDSAYHGMPKLVDEDGPETEDQPGCAVVLLA